MSKGSKAVVLTGKFVKGAVAPSRSEYTDASCPGLRLRTSHPDTRVFAFKGRNAAHIVRTVTIGSYPDVSLREARERAAEIRRALRDGKDPVAQKRSQREAMAARSTLRDVLLEYQAIVAGRLASWRVKSGSPKSEARGRIETVFAGLLDRPLKEITDRDLAQAMASYVPTRRRLSANGQVSRARAYLSPVLDWAAGRRRFAKLGAGRAEPLATPDLSATHDPAKDDPTITGRRDRALDQDELERLLPLLVHPARICLRCQTPTEIDIRPAALRFILLTGARRGEVTLARRKHFNDEIGVWHKPHIKSKGRPRSQDLPLSDDALALLRSLPGWRHKDPEALVFSVDGMSKLDNWSRITKAIQRESGTSGWHRHDLRRTASTLMTALKVAAPVIDSILGHRNPWKREDVSQSFGNYAILRRTLRNAEDPQRVALNQLAAILREIEAKRARRRADVEHAVP